MLKRHTKLTPRRRILVERLIVSQLVKKVPTLYAT